MPIRKTILSTGGFYHIFNKSIAKYRIFNTTGDYNRFIDEMRFFRCGSRESRFSRMTGNKHKSSGDGKNELVRVIAYVIMPTHYHLIIRQERENGISEYVNCLQKSYSLYFNKKHNRTGPLWQGRFKSVPIESDAQLIHLTRYIHLNPVTAYLAGTPLKWEYSSYPEYINPPGCEKICDFRRFISLTGGKYAEFCADGIDYQRNLAKIKKLLLD